MIIAYVTTVPQSFNFFKAHIRYMKEGGFEIHAVSSQGENLDEIEKEENIKVHAINMARNISPLSDFLALKKLYLLFVTLKPTLVHASFPKGGFLGVIAARLARVPHVVYGLRGLRFDTAVGLRRGLLWFAEALSCRLAHLVICNSFSNRKRAISLGLCRGERIRVLAGGSSNGVDAEKRFNPRNLSAIAKQQVRDNFQIPGDALVVGYVGRIVRDKGIAELEQAWQILKKRFAKLILLLVGPIESHDPVAPRVIKSLKEDKRVRFVGLVKETAPLYGIMDILVLPSHREGFPNTPLEAAAMELPVVSTLVDGCTEAVGDGVTGLLVPPRNCGALAEAISLLLSDPGMRRQMGINGRRRVIRDFKPEIIWQALYENYVELLSGRLS